MAEDDDAISAMWRSLVPPTTMEVDVHAETAESTMDISIWNGRHYGGMVDICNNEYAKAEAATVVDMQRLADYAEDVNSKTMICWNQEEMMVRGYPEDIETLVAVADVESSLFYHPAAGCSHHTLRQDPLSVVVAAQVNHTITEQGGDDHATRPDVPAPIVIYRAPEMREYTPTSNPFKPQFLLIGPYHHGQQRQQLEKKFKDYFVTTVLEMNRSIPAKVYAQKIKDEEKRVQKYYIGISNVSSNELARTLMFDACAILGFLDVLPSKQEPQASEQELDQAKQEEAECDTEMDYFPFKREHIIFQDLPPWSFGRLAYDIILMENQIPFFIVEMVYDLATYTSKISEKVSALRSQMVKFLHEILKPYPTTLTVGDKATNDFQYILHYCHMYFTPSDLQDASSPSAASEDIEFTRWYGATDLYQSGINFKRISKDNSRSLLDIKFNNGVLEIPTLVINSKTSLLFSNIIAYEQSLRRSNLPNKYFISYIKFMNDLIAVPSDVTLLARKKIIESHFGKEEEIIKLFNTLMEGVTSTSDADGYLKPVYSKLNEYCKYPFNKWLADLKHKYFKTPWLAIGVVVGIVALVSTIVGVVYNVKGHDIHVSLH